MTPYHHALSSAKKFGGCWEDNIDIHMWFDETKQYTGDWTHRALRHHSAGVEWCIKEHGDTVRYYTTCDDFKDIPVKLIAEQHIIEDCGFIPTPQDWLKCLVAHPASWMRKVQMKYTTKLEEVDDV